MNDAAHLDSFYKAGRIVLWVEDSLTRDYLRAAWRSPVDIAFFVANGGEHVPSLATAARQNSPAFQHVFGILDRDFGYSNRASWNTADNFYLPRHEIENYLLDADAFTASRYNTRNRSCSDVTTEIQRLAKLQPAWLACRQTLKTLRHQATDGFSRSPSLLDIVDPPTAVNHIVTLPWFQQVASRLTFSLTVVETSRRIDEAIVRYQTDLLTDDWVANFSGKEIFRQLRAYTYLPPHKTGNLDNDFAKSVGSWQAANDRVPPDIHDLLLSLRMRVGIHP